MRVSLDYRIEKSVGKSSLFATFFSIYKCFPYAVEHRSEFQFRYKGFKFSLTKFLKCIIPAVKKGIVAGRSVGR